MKIIAKFILLIFILSSCSLLITQKIILGVREPKVKSIEKIQKFIVKKNGINDSLFSLDKENFIIKISNSSKYFAKWELYNNQGNLLIPCDSNVNFCNGYTHLFFKNLQENNYRIDSSTNIYFDTAFINGLTFLNGEKYNLKESINSDYILIIYWATFMGKYSSDLFELERIAKNNNQISIATLKINMDFKESYGFSNKDIKIKQKVEKNRKS